MSIMRLEYLFKKSFDLVAVLFKLRIYCRRRLG